MLLFERLILPSKVLELIWADKEQQVAWCEWGWEVDAQSGGGDIVGTGELGNLFSVSIAFP